MSPMNDDDGMMKEGLGDGISFFNASKPFFKCGNDNLPIS